MLTNPNWNVHTDYEVNHVFKPDAANQLAATIPYDYVITQAMLDWGLDPDNGAYNASTNTVDITKVLLGSKGKTSGITPKKRISIMIDAVTDDSLSLDFKDLYGAPWFQTSVASTNQLDIYCRASFTFTGRAYLTRIYNNLSSRVQIPSTAVSAGTLYIGCMSCQSGSWTWSGTLIYEDAYGNIAPGGQNVAHSAWMTNKIPVSINNIPDIGNITPACIIHHTHDIKQGEQDDPAKTAVMEMLAKGVVPFVSEDFTEGIFKVYPLIRLGTEGANNMQNDPLKCAPIFRDEEGKRELRLIAGTGADEGHYIWDIVFDASFPQIIDFPGENSTQLDVYNMLVANVATYGLPKLRYLQTGTTYIIADSYYNMYSSTSYNFFWVLTFGGTTTTLWMNDQGTWNIQQ